MYKCRGDYLSQSAAALASSGSPSALSPGWARLWRYAACSKRSRPSAAAANGASHPTSRDPCKPLRIYAGRRAPDVGGRINALQQSPLISQQERAPLRRQAARPATPAIPTVARARACDQSRAVISPKGRQPRHAWRTRAYAGSRRREARLGRAVMRAARPHSHSQGYSGRTGCWRPGRTGPFARPAGLPRRAGAGL